MVGLPNERESKTPCAKDNIARIFYLPFRSVFRYKSPNSIPLLPKIQGSDTGGWLLSHRPRRAGKKPPPSDHSAGENREKEKEKSENSPTNLPIRMRYLIRPIKTVEEK